MSITSFRLFPLFVLLALAAPCKSQDHLAVQSSVLLTEDTSLEPTERSYPNLFVDSRKETVVPRMRGMSNQVQSAEISDYQDFLLDHNNRLLVRKQDSWWHTWGRCAVGTGGGGLVGATIGSRSDHLGDPWGVILGSVGGAMLGASFTCFR